MQRATREIMQIYRKYGFRNKSECPKCNRKGVIYWQGLLYTFSGGGQFECKKCGWKKSIKEIEADGGSITYQTPHIDYDKYIRSREWKAKAQAKIYHANCKCERCGKTGIKLEVHHLHYNSLGNERMEDLLAVCRKCHLEIELEKLS